MKATLRDQIAIAAMQSLIISAPQLKSADISVMAYRFADIMLHQREINADKTKTTSEKH